MGHNSRTFSKDHKNAKSSKEGTKKNIKTSLNKLQTRNETLFGPRGKNLYNPNSRFDYGGAYDMYPFGGVNTKTHTHFDEGGPNTNPTTPAPANSSMSESDQWMANFLAKQAAEKALRDEESKVARVKGNLIPTAKALDAADDKILNENGAVYDAFQKMRNAANPQELQALIRNAPAELKNVLPQGGNYNIAQWDKKAGDWNPQSTPGRELYCTPYGCYTYQKAGATDVPTIGGNYGFVGGVAKGELPFKKVSASEARPGDMAIIYGNQPADYRDPDSRWVDRPHHTGVLAELPKIDKSGKAVEMSFYNANEGNRLSYGKNTRSPNDRNKDSRYEYYSYTGQVPKLQQAYEEAQRNFANSPGQYMQPIQAQLTQSPDEREIIIPQQSTMANLSSRKKGGSLSGAPYDGQPTAKTFFGQTWIPPGPVGFYKLGGQNTDGIAFPQQVPDNYFFAGVPWQNSLGHFAYGGGLPGGANQGMPCLECGGYMEMGGDTQFGGGVDGGMDYFEKGGHWIQEAKSSMRNNLRAIAKKNYGGVNDTALDPQGDYIGDMKNGFKKSIALGFGLATADDIAKNYDAMGQNASMGSTPMANYGYNMGYNSYPGGINQDNLNNYNMAQGMLDNIGAKRKMNNSNLLTGATSFAKEFYDPNRNYVKWDLQKADPLTNLKDEPETAYSKYGGGLYKAAFGVDAFGNPSPNQMGPLSQQETNQRTIDQYRNLPWNQQAGQQGPPQFQGGLYPNVYPRGYRDPYSGWDGQGSMPWITSSNAPRGGGGFYTEQGPSPLSDINPSTGKPWGGIDPGFDGQSRQSAADKERRAYERERYIDEMMRNQGSQGRYREQNPDYWMSQNGQTRYDYGNPGSWDNLNQRSGDFGGSWNTRGWNSPNPYYNQMFGDPSLTTRLASVTPERGMFGDLFNRSGTVRNPKKITYRFNTYVNPRTGQVEKVPVPTQTPAGPAGPQQTPANKPGNKSKLESTERPADQALTNPQAFNPGFPVYNSNNPLKAVPIPPESTQRPDDQAIQNNPAFNPGFPTYNSANPLKSVPASSGNGWDNATKGQLPGSRADVMNTPPLSDRQKAIANSMQNQFSGPSQQSSNSVNSSVSSPVNMDPRQMQNMPMTSNYPLPQGQVLLPPGSGSDYDFMSSAQNPSAGPVNTPAPATSQLPAVPPRISGDYNFMNDVQNSDQRPGPVNTPPITPATGNYDFMSDLQNNQRPGPLMQQAYGGMPDYGYAYGGMPDYGYSHGGAPHYAFAYGGYLPMAQYGIVPGYEQTMMEAGQADLANDADPNGGYALTSTKKKQKMSGQNIYGTSMALLGAGENIALAPQMNALQKDVMDRTMSHNMNSAVNGYKGNTKVMGMGAGSDFGGISDSPQGFTKQGGMIYANGGAYQTGIPIDLTDDEIQAIYAAGGTVSYV